MAQCRVTYRMTDQMGVVYYGNYFEFFEIGRSEWLRSHGLEYRDMETEGYFLPATHASCDYLSPARFDELIEIETRVMALTRVKIHFGYVIRRSGEDRPLARGVTHHVFLSPGGKIRRLSPQWWDRLAPLAPPQRKELNV